MVDDIIVGGATKEEAAANYIAILEKLHKANLKVSAEKTHIFPESADILGWQWHQGGRLEPSPHRRNALTNMKQEDIKKVRDMRSWIGLYKTLRIATPHQLVGAGPLGPTGNRYRRRRWAQGPQIIWNSSVLKSSRLFVLLGLSVIYRFQIIPRVVTLGIAPPPTGGGGAPGPYREPVPS